MKLAWHALARDKPREALLYYHERAGRCIAEDFNMAVMRAAKQLLQYPELGSRTGVRQGAFLCMTTHIAWYIGSRRP